MTPPDITHSALTSSCWGEGRQGQDVSQIYVRSEKCLLSVVVSASWEEVDPCLALQVMSSSLHYYSHYYTVPRPAMSW